MSEMISLYLDQTPPLIESMKVSFGKKDWQMLNTSVHKMIPSFSIMGINPDLEAMAKKIQDFARSHEDTDLMQSWVTQVEESCLKACEGVKNGPDKNKK